MKLPIYIIMCEFDLHYICVNPIYIMCEFYLHYVSHARSLRYPFFFNETHFRAETHIYILLSKWLLLTHRPSSHIHIIFPWPKYVTPIYVTHIYVTPIHVTRIYVTHIHVTYTYICCYTYISIHPDAHLPSRHRQQLRRYMSSGRTSRATHMSTIFQ